MMLVGFFLWFASATVVHAQEFQPTPIPVTDDQVNAIAKQLYCPVCENIPLDTCGTQACEEWRQLIRSQLEQGWTEQQILQFFVERYGERVLAVPRPQRHWLIYILPLLVVMAGAGILWRVLRASPSESSRTAPHSLAPDKTDLPEEWVQRLESTLKDW